MRRPDAGEAGGLARAAARHVRLQPARAAADQRLQPDAEAGPAGGAGRRIGQRQVHRRQARRRPVSALGGRGPVRRRPRDEDPARASSRIRWRWSIRTSRCSRARSATTSRLWDDTVEEPGCCRRPATPASTTTSPTGPAATTTRRGAGAQLQRRAAPAARDRARAGRQPADPGARRSDQRARRAHREAGRRRTCGGAAARA